MSQAARLDVMEEILLEDRFAAALAAAPAISCAVPMPPTMPAVKISANGLPMPFRLESNAPIFHRHGKKRPASAGPVMKLLDNDDVIKMQGTEIAELTAAAHEKRREFNHVRQQSADREERLESLQVRAKLAVRDGRDEDDELEYMRALRAATEGELERVAARTVAEEFASDQFEYMLDRLVTGTRATKKHIDDVKKALRALEWNLASADARSSELQNGAEEAARQLAVFQGHLGKQRAQDAAVLSKAREQASRASLMAIDCA